MKAGTRAALKAWERAQTAALACRIATARAVLRAQIASKRRALSHGGKMPGAPGRKRRKAAPAKRRKASKRSRRR